MRTMGAATAFGVERSLYGMNGALNNFYAGDATQLAGASISNKSAFPVGYVHPYCWHPAMKGGGLACRVITGTGEVTDANGANGYNIDAEIGKPGQHGQGGVGARHDGAVLAPGNKDDGEGDLVDGSVHK